MSRRLSRHLAAGLIAAIAPHAAADSARAEPPPPVPLERNCFYVLSKGTGELIQCMHPAWLTDEERADLKRITRNFLEDARCRVDVRIERRKVEEALEATDHTFEAPPQPVVCEIKTASRVVPISATFAPKVVFKNGVAVDGTPGLANVEGVNSYLAWPVVQYVNNAERIRSAMLEMINRYRSQRQAQLPAR